MSNGRQTVRCGRLSTSHAQPRTLNVISNGATTIDEHTFALWLATATTTCTASALNAATVAGIVTRLAHDTELQVSEPVIRGWLASRGVDILANGRTGIRISSPWAASARHAFTAIRKDRSGHNGGR